MAIESSSAEGAVVVRGGRGRVAGRFLTGLVTALLVLGVGLIGGYVAGKQSSSAGAGGHGEGEHAGEAPGEHAAHEGAPSLTPQTLANLGIETGELKATEFVRSREVAAVVVEPRGARRRAYAPVAGLLRRVFVRPGSVVKAGDPVAEILRDPFPRPTLTLTDSLLRSLDEEFHRAVAELRTSSLALELAHAELERVRKILGASASPTSLPSKTEIDLQREAQRAQRSLEIAREEARRHGLTADEVAGIEAGTQPAPKAPDVHRVLDARLLWGPPADRVVALLPESIRSAPFIVALVGELFAAGLLSPELEDALRTRPGIRDAFFDVAGLLQSGETVEGVLSLASLGALRPAVLVLAPADAPDWDVVVLGVVAGAHIDRGGEVATLLAPHRMALRLAPTGDDVVAIEASLAGGEALVAEPQQLGVGPTLSGLRVTRFEPPAEAGGLAAPLVEFDNIPLAVAPAAGDSSAAPAPQPRSWRFREGARYRVQVPLKHMPDRFVLPAGALITRGADQVVVVKEGRTWRQVPVHVEYLDARVAVVPAANGGLFAGDTVVMRGAYALALALQAAAGGGGADPHAGHNH